MEDKSYKEKMQDKLNDWKGQIEHLNLQMNLGASEARDEFEKQKSKVLEFVGETNVAISEWKEEGKEELKELQKDLEELRVQAALGRAEAEDAFEAQRKDLKTKLDEVQSEARSIYSKAEGKTKDFADKVEDQVNTFETNFDTLWVQFNLGKAEAKEYWEGKRKEASVRLQEMQHKVNQGVEEGSEKWDDFSSEMKEAWKHVKKAFD